MYGYIVSGTKFQTNISGIWFVVLIICPNHVRVSFTRLCLFNITPAAIDIQSFCLCFCCSSVLSSDNTTGEHTGVGVTPALCLITSCRPEAAEEVELDDKVGVAQWRHVAVSLLHDG